MNDCRWLVLVLCIFAFPTSCPAAVGADGASQRSLLAIDLRSTAGEAISFDGVRLRVYCVLGTECPVSRFYAGRLTELAEQYASQGVRFVGIHSNLHDSVADIGKFATELSLSFPQVHDEKQLIAKQLKATRVPEVFVIDAEGALRYSGRVDDQYAPGVKRAAATVDHLKSAIDTVLAGKVPPITRVEPVGCLITFEKLASTAPTVATTPTTDITYCKTIAPLFNEHCVECHRPGEIGPFDISDFDELRGWSEMIVEVVEQKRMPPWHADPQFGSFKNERHMPESALAVLKQWVEAGAPYGDASDLPPTPKFIDGWNLLRAPELIVAMREKAYTIPAKGTVDYQYFVVDPKITEDRWVSAAQIVPGNSAVVHHAIVFVRPPDGIDFQGIGWLTAYVPGQRATIFPPGYARKIPAGSKFVFQMHYTPNGHEQTDVSQIGMTFMDPTEVTHEVFTMIGIDQEFEIPPGAESHVVNSSVKRLPRDGMLLAVSPHMHLRGKSFQMRAIANQESTADHRATLLSVPQYDFNWQHTYEFSEPMPFSEIKSLELTTTFDNSPSNPFNPAPQEYVVWGDQTWEEMSVAFLEVAQPLKRGADVKALQTAQGAKLTTAGTTTAESTLASPTETELQFVSNFLLKFDTNKDDKVIVDEVPRIVRDYGFRQIDKDSNGVVTREELVEAARMQRGK